MHLACFWKHTLSSRAQDKWEKVLQKVRCPLRRQQYRPRTLLCHRTVQHQRIYLLEIYKWLHYQGPYLEDSKKKKKIYEICPQVKFPVVWNLQKLRPNMSNTNTLQRFLG